MDWLSKELLLPLAIGMAILVGGHHLLKKYNPALRARFVLGLVLLSIGIGCGYYLTDILGNLEQHPLMFGLAIGALGLGINQVAAPLRVAFGGAA